jgi:hypothetical protein
MVPRINKEKKEAGKVETVSVETKRLNRKIKFEVVFHKDSKACSARRQSHQPNQQGTSQSKPSKKLSETVI